MGVHGLWDLLSPVGRRVSVETLAGKKLAIDASIWLIQFVKAMRDEKGEMVRNAHLLGFFRRICKLLYLRTKPVFIFDGGTPALKRRTVIARRRQRENAQAKIRKTAEKLLLNQLKQIRVKEVADELENQRRSNVSKGKNIVSEEADVVDKKSARSKLFSDSCNQEAIDEMLAASLAAEEDEAFTAAEPSSALPIPAEDEDAEEDEEMILPTIEGKIDPAILAALPPSMQLDLLVQMRERLMAENRKKYQRVKKVPARFSELQIQAYLKTVAFRREIDEVQKSAAGRGIGGVQTSRIASEANREYIFSSNYNGDKLVLTSTGEGMKTSDQSRAANINSSGTAANNVASLEKCSAVVGFPVDEPQKDLENDVETYLDERGRVRVSRVRAMGIRMTRDIQRNLDLMKEIEGEREGKTNNLRNQSGYGATQGNSSDEDPCGMIFENVKNEENVLDAGTSMEISFEDNGQHELGGEDDDLFTQLVAGDPVMDFSLDNSLSKKQSLDSASEPEWEEGGVEDEDGALSNDIEPKGKVLQVDGPSVEQELEWEEGSVEIQEDASVLPAEYEKVVSKGAQEEEADIQEAIRRSLQELEDRTCFDEPDKSEKSRKFVEVASCSADAGFTNKEGDWRGGESPSGFSSIQQKDSLSEFQENTKGADIVVKRKLTEANDPLEVHLTTQLRGTCGKMEVLPVKERQSNPGLQDVNQYVDSECSLEQDVHELDTSVQENGACQVQLTFPSGSDNMVAADGDLAIADGHSKRATETEKAPEKDSAKDINNIQESAEEEVHDYSNRGQESFDKVASSDYRKEDFEVTEASLEEEMLILGEEYKELADKQRKLERNAESVNSELFAECQELLQIFGIPYIIAPMEAEAQCAYMELVNLVDGVVTDDSDAFLFGARNVYKNIFDDRKYVETYFMKDIENELGLHREKLIRMALLLGSDYTEGVSGIGIVNAIEVVNAFPEEDGLHKFREWIESPDPSILGKFDAQAGGSSKQIELQVGNLESFSGSKSIKVSASDGHFSGSGDEAQMKKQSFMDKHRNVSKNWHIPSSFPSEAVTSAYSSPQVDKSTDPFSWGKPDQYVLRKLCWEKFGWSTQKADELLLPVLREYNKRETQLRLEAFYTFNERFAKIQSKRIKKAVKGITGNKSLDLMDESVEDGSRKKRKSKVNQDDTAGVTPEKASKGKEYTEVRNETIITEKLNGKKLRKTNAIGEAQLAVESQIRLPIEEETCESGSRSRGANVKGRSGGAGTGKHSSTKRARRKGNSSSEYSVSCSDDEIRDEAEQDSRISSREPCQVRRSGRNRKEVKYVMSDTEFDHPNQDDRNPNNENGAAAGEEPFSDVMEAALHSEIQEPIDPELCLDEEAKQDKVTDQIDACQTAAKTQLSEDNHLTMGGGFCMDEEGTGTDTDRNMQGLSTTTTSSTRERVGDSDLPNCSEDENTAGRNNSSEEVERMGMVPEASFTNYKSHSDTNIDRSEHNINEDAPRKESFRSFRAMPNLKRKRRKN